jgi:hypothetical protein
MAARNMIPAAYPTCSTTTARTALSRWANMPCTGALTIATIKATASTIPNKASRMNVPHRAPIANSPAPIQYIFPISPLRGRLRSASSARHLLAATNRPSIERYRLDSKVLAQTAAALENLLREDNAEKMTLFSTNQPVLKTRLIDQNVRKILLTNISEKSKDFFPLLESNFCHYVTNLLHDFCKKMIG